MNWIISTRPGHTISHRQPRRMPSQTNPRVTILSDLPFIVREQERRQIVHQMEHIVRRPVKDGVLIQPVARIRVSTPREHTIKGNLRMARIVLGRIAAPPLVRSWIDKTSPVVPLILNASLSTSSTPRHRRPVSSVALCHLLTNVITNNSLFPLPAVSFTNRSGTHCTLSAEPNRPCRKNSTTISFVRSSSALLNKLMLSPASGIVSLITPGV